MKLTIEILCNDGVEMENNLSKAIDDFSKVLEDRGFTEMELVGYKETLDSSPIYKLTLEK